MALGNNRPQEQKQDKLIKDTRKARNTCITRIKSKKGVKTKEKMTFYIENELLEALYNFKYWERKSLTAAFNEALKDGLKGKNIKQRKC